MEHIRDTLDLLKQVMDAHKNIVLWASGGKDSTVLLHLARPWADRLTILSVIMDNGFPGVQEHVEGHCASWGYAPPVIVPPLISFPDYVATYGWPAQLLPTAMEGTMPDPFYDGGPKLSSWWHCSVLRVVAPLVQASKAAGAEAVLTASRKMDAPVHGRIGPIIEAHDTPEAGWTRYDLMHDWTTAQVWDYIDEHAIPLPDLYTWKRYALTEMPDCRECMFNSDYAHWTKKNDPETFQRVWPSFGPALARMKQLANAELARWEGIED